MVSWKIPTCVWRNKTVNCCSNFSLNSQKNSFDPRVFGSCMQPCSIRVRSGSSVAELSIIIGIIYNSLDNGVSAGCANRLTTSVCNERLCRADMHIRHCSSFSLSSTLFPLLPFEETGYCGGWALRSASLHSRKDKDCNIFMVLGLVIKKIWWNVDWKKCAFQSLKSPCYLSPVKRLQRAVNDTQLLLSQF